MCHARRYARNRLNGGARFEDFLSPRGIIEVTIVLKYGQNLAPFTRIPLENVIEPKPNLN